MICFNIASARIISSSRSANACLLYTSIVAHEFLGSSVEGKDVIIIDDMISSGDSIIDVATELKRRKAKRIFAAATFGPVSYTHLDVYKRQNTIIPSTG